MAAKNDSLAAQPAPRATVILLTGLIYTVGFAQGETASALAKSYAMGIGLSFLASTLADYRGNIRNLVRTDVMALASFYFLTLAEYCVAQPTADAAMTAADVGPALTACVIGICAIALGRHFHPAQSRILTRMMNLQPPRNLIFLLFALCFTGGYLYMLASVNWSVGDMVDAFMAPRFAQPWGRGKFGDWRALLYEFGMVLYLVPPIGGVVLADRKSFTKIQVALVAAGLAFTFFFGYTSGTRNIFATYLATALVAYAFTAGRVRRLEIMGVAAMAAIAMLYATTTMLEFRSIGYRQYLQSGGSKADEAEEKSFFVDNNLYVIAQLTRVFPQRHEYLGFEIPYLAIIRPIPRALWSGKPEGMSYSIEEALDAAEGYTIAATFAGEAYMSGGFIGVALFGLVLGSIMGWWNEFGRENNSTFGHLVYASGFFAAVISMRSLLVFTTAILPTIAALIFGFWAFEARLNRRRPINAPTNE